MAFINPIQYFVVINNVYYKINFFIM